MSDLEDEEAAPFAFMDALKAESIRDYRWLNLQKENNIQYKILND